MRHCCSEPGLAVAKSQRYHFYTNPVRTLYRSAKCGVIYSPGMRNNNSAFTGRHLPAGSDLYKWCGFNGKGGYCHGSPVQIDIKMQSRVFIYLNNNTLCMMYFSFKYTYSYFTWNHWGILLISSVISIFMFSFWKFCMVCIVFWGSIFLFTACMVWTKNYTESLSTNRTNLPINLPLKCQRKKGTRPSWTAVNNTDTVCVTGART